MATVIASPILAERTLADLLEELGNVPPGRIMLKGPIGAASERDVLEVENRTGLAPELIMACLWRRPRDTWSHFWPWPWETICGSSSCPGNWVSFSAKEVRCGSFSVRSAFPTSVSSPRGLPRGKLPKTPIPGIVPDLAIEILSEPIPRARCRQIARVFHRGRTFGLVYRSTCADRDRLHRDRPEPNAHGAGLVRWRRRLARISVVAGQVVRRTGFIARRKP